MDHSPGFLKLVAEAKKNVNEISVAEARARLAADKKVVLIDVREDHEWNAQAESQIETDPLWIDIAYERCWSQFPQLRPALIAQGFQVTEGTQRRDTTAAPVPAP